MTRWEQLITARDEKHVSQVEAAELLNVGLGTYQRWESGKAKPQPQHMRRLYEVFQLEQGNERAAVETSHTPTFSKNPLRELPIVAVQDELDEPQVFITTNMLARLWSLAFMDHPTHNEKRDAIQRTIKEFDAMNPTDKNYHITRREALYSLATLPMITLGLSLSGKTLSPTQYGSALAHCAASLEACFELSKSNEVDDLIMAFQSVSKYLSMLETIVQTSSQHRKDALHLAVQYALLKTILGRHCAGPTEAIQYAKNAVVLSKETEDISLQLSAYSKLAGTYFFDKKYVLAEKTAQEAEFLLHQYSRRSNASPLHACIYGGTYSTLALMQAKNGKPSDIALGKAVETDPGNENFAFMDFKRSSLLLDAGWVYCYQGNQGKAVETLEQRVDLETLSARIPQSELGRLETIHVMTLSSLRAKDRDMEKTIHLWVADIEGAKMLKSELIFNDAVTTYELMEIAWPDEVRIKDLRDHIVHWE